MEDNDELEIPLAACAVGRMVDVQLIGDSSYRRAKITGYDANRNQHSLKFEDNGKERSVILRKLRFKWAVEGPKELKPGSGERFELAVKRDAVGRRLEVYSPKFDKYYQGKIVEFVEQANKHKVLFEKGNQTKMVNLQKHKWRFTDLVKGKKYGRGHNFKTSMFIGVSRQSEFTWQVSMRRGGKTVHIGAFPSEKEAALAHDVYARKANKPTNFIKEQWTESDVKRHRKKEPHCLRGGTSKYRGVSFQRRTSRWTARVTSKHLGFFTTEYHAALAADAEMRRQGWHDHYLNHPNENVSDNQIRAWESKNTQCVLRASNQRKSSQYRGVCWKGQRRSSFVAQVRIKKVVRGEGQENNQLNLGYFKSEQQAALAYDRVCRKHGIPERELNFPRNFRLDALRSFDDECYYCYQESPEDPLATPCNHIFCTQCVDQWFQKEPKCPCCSTLIESKDSLRRVTLTPREKPLTRRKKRSREEEPTRASPPETRARPVGKRRRVEKEGSLSPRFPIGTRFLKNFKRHGKYEGRITSFDGEHYKVFYPRDGDEEELSEYEFDSRGVEILEESDDLREQPSTESLEEESWSDDDEES